jgi:hypothetical protein
VPGNVRHNACSGNDHSSFPNHRLVSLHFSRIASNKRGQQDASDSGH